MKTINDRLYETFTAHERVNLTIAALGRSDEAEVIKLRQTCPKKSYKANDANYSDKMEAIEDITMRYVGLCQCYHNQITKWDAHVFCMQSTLSHYEFGFELARNAIKGKEQLNQESLDIFYRKSEELFKFQAIFEEKKNNSIRYLKAVNKALLDFYAKAEISSESMLGWIHAQLIQLCEKIDEYLATEIEYDTATYETVLDAFQWVWGENK